MGSDDSSLVTDQSERGKDFLHIAEVAQHGNPKAGFDHDQHGRQQYGMFERDRRIFQHVHDLDLVASLEVLLAEPSQISPGLGGVRLIASHEESESIGLTSCHCGSIPRASTSVHHWTQFLPYP